MQLSACSARGLQVFQALCKCSPADVPRARLWEPQCRQEVPHPPAPPSSEGWPLLTSALGYVAGTSQAEPVAAGAWCAAELANPVLVGPRRARHTLAGLPAEVGARPTGHCGGKVERLLGAEVRSGGQPVRLSISWHPELRLCPSTEGAQTLPRSGGLRVGVRRWSSGRTLVSCLLLAAAA